MIPLLHTGEGVTTLVNLLPKPSQQFFRTLEVDVVTSAVTLIGCLDINKTSHFGSPEDVETSGIFQNLLLLLLLRLILLEKILLLDQLVLIDQFQCTSSFSRWSLRGGVVII